MRFEIADYKFHLCCLFLLYTFIVPSPRCECEVIILIDKVLSGCTLQVNAKIADYGISQFTTLFGLTAQEGTPAYRAPEVVRGETYSFQVRFKFKSFIHKLSQMASLSYTAVRILQCYEILSRRKLIIIMSYERIFT